MTDPEIRSVVQKRVDFLRHQLDAAEAFLRSLDGEAQAKPQTSQKRKTSKAHSKEHPFAQDGLTHREHIRKIIHAHEDGLTPTQMREIATKEGRSIPASYPYAQLAKLKQDKEVRASGGKYFPPKGSEGRANASTA